MAKLFDKNNLTKIDFFSIIDVAAKRVLCTYKGAGFMKRFLPILILVSSTTFAEGIDWSKATGAVGSIGGAVGSQASSSELTNLELIESENRLRKKGVDPEKCGKCSEQNWASVEDSGVGDCANPTRKWFTEEDKYDIGCDSDKINKKNVSGCETSQSSFCAVACSNKTNFVNCGVTPECQETKEYNKVKATIEEKIEENKTECKKYLALKKSKISGLKALGDLVNVASQIGGLFLANGCDDYCGSYTGNDQIRCYCQHTGRDGKPCKEPSSSECKKVGTESCQEQMDKLGINDPALLAACDCGKRNDVDPRGGWHVNEQNVCVNYNNNNNNNTDEPFKPGYGKTDLAGLSNANNNNAAAAEAVDKASGSSSKLGAASAGNRGGVGNNNKAKDKERPDMDLGRGSSRASGGMGEGRGYYPGVGGGQDFKVKKGEKIKDIAKSDGEDIFKMISAVYKSQIDANALDSTRPVSNIEKKTKVKKTKGKKV